MLIRGVPESATSLMLSSLSEGTLKQYDSVYRKWWTYCKEKGQNLYQFKLASFLDFLEKQVRNSLSYSSLNIYRSALNLIAPPNAADANLIKRFLKGIYNIRPPQPKYNSTWDPQIVLNHLKKMHPLESLNLENLTLKLVMLLALTTGHRPQTLSKIHLDNITFSSTDISIKITDKVKTSGLHKCQPLLQFRVFKDNPDLCVASLISYYINETKHLRTPEEKYLILTHKKPHHKATSQTISRWLKKVLHLSGVNTDIFSGYSTRHASTSAAYRSGTNIDTIRNAAGWTNTSNVFNKFYNLPVTCNDNFESAILNLSSTGVDPTLE